MRKGRSNADQPVLVVQSCPADGLQSVSPALSVERLDRKNIEDPVEAVFLDLRWKEYPDLRGARLVGGLHRVKNERAIASGG
jgi:hypothetical protein